MNRSAGGGADVERQLAEAREQQSAIAEILRVMADAPADVTVVLDTIAKGAAQLCRAPFARMTIVEGDILRPIAGYAADDQPAPAAGSVPFARTSIQGRAIIERRTLHFDDIAPIVEHEFPAAVDNARSMGFRAVLSVPLLRGDVGLGSIFLYRREPGLFSPDQVALVETFARQAAIALHSVQQFRATQDALEQQQATSEILRVIATSPGSAQPVFDSIASAALRLCRAESVFVAMLDGDLLRLAAMANVDPASAERMRRRYPRPVGPGTATGRAIASRAIAMVPDCLADPDYDRDNASVLFRSAVAVPLLQDGVPIGAIGLGRAAPGPFEDGALALLQTFASQAVIAIENARLVTAMQQRNRDLSEALEQRTATSDILRVISRSPTDVQPVFDTIAAAALSLCRAASALVTRLEGDSVVLVASANLTEEGAQAMREAFPMQIGRQATSARAIREGRMIVIPDVVDDPDYKIQDLALRAAFRSTLAVPLMRDGRPIGTITVGKPEPGPFSDSQVALLETFAEQAVIAIENVRLFNELDARNTALTEALEQQTATSDILRVISRSQQDVQPVFDTIVRSVKSLCDAAFSGVYLVDGGMLTLAATEGMTPRAAEVFATGYPRPLGPDTVAGRAALESRVVASADLMNDPDYAGAPGTLVGARTVLSVPLVRNGRAIGAIGVWRERVEAFSDTQVALLQTFAEQAVIAIENVRLFNELDARNRALSEALEQQTATSDILRVISRSQTNVQPVFDTIAESVLSLCRARFANVFTYDGALIHVAALVNDNPDYIKTVKGYYPQPPSRNTAVTRAIATGEVCVIPDVLDDADYQFPAASAGGGFRSILAVPLMREGKPVGGIAVGRPEPGPFPESQVALLQTFADQAVIAIENVRLFNELQARTGQLARSVDELRALGDVGQAVSSTLDLATVLSTIVSRARSLMGVEGASVYEYDEAREAFILRSSDGLPAELVDALHKTPMRPGEGALGRIALTRQPVEIADIADERAYQSRVRKLLVGLGLRSMLAVPLLRESHLLGGLVINRRAPGGFDPEVVGLLRTFATQSALAIQNARLYREIEIKSRELETASRHKSEFLANMSHELRTPLNAIIGFSEVLAERLFGELNAKQAEYVTDIAESGRHLLDLINDILDLSKIEAGRMELDASEIDLPRTVEQTLVLVRERAERRGIALTSAIGDGVGTIHADARKVKQVLLNLLSNALKFTPAGGRIDVRASAFDDRVEVSVADTGVGIAPEDQDAVFEEFRQVGASAAKAEGTGLGLAISRKFIELHGGRIFLRSAPGAGSTFTFTLPIRR
ncbi:MAG: GAF domain-containing protein [Burkholderiales bacterium]